MKYVSIPLEDQEHADLTRIRGNESWHDFLVRLAKQEDPLNGPAAGETTQT